MNGTLETDNLSIDFINNLTFPNNFYVEFNVPILVQAKYHKKSRINKKWIKRYGFKKDLIQCVMPECILSKQNERNEINYLTPHRLITQDICRLDFESSEIQTTLPTYISNNNKLIWFLGKENNL